MIVSNNDIKRIEQCGYQKKDFVIRKDGWQQLKNKNHRCVFHDGTTCIIYPNRPVGCQLYPIIYDMDTKEAVLDEDCPYTFFFEITDAKKRILFEVIDKVMNEH